MTIRCDICNERDGETRAQEQQRRVWWKEGVTARKSGVLFKANPYDSNGHAHTHWANGWFAGAS